MILNDKKFETLKSELDQLVDRFNAPGFIENDPISIPHQFSLKQDIEIMGFWTAILAWGKRSVIINKAKEIISLMDGSPYDFILNHKESDRSLFSNFKHRTFQYTDSLYFLDFLQRHYKKHNSLEDAFLLNWSEKDKDVENALIGFNRYFFNTDYAPQRTRKHIASPLKKSTCKRLNMFLRWMVRKDNKGVDFGIWESIKMHQLCLPLDVHVQYSARRLGLLTRMQNDWLAAKQLSAKMRQFDPGDPAKYDFALFGLGLLRNEFGF